MGENTLGRETLCFSGKVAPRVAEAGPLYPRLQFDLGKLSTKSAQDFSESSICTSKCETTEAFRALLEDEVGKMCTRL
jgi:hypothetical protein